MDYNNNRYLFVSASTLNLMDEAHVLERDLIRLRKNIAGTQWIVEVAPGSPYYNLSFAKTHEEALAIVAGPDWSQDDEL